MGCPFIRLSVVLWKNDFHLTGYISEKMGKWKKVSLKKVSENVLQTVSEKIITGKK